jgi:peptidoglycan/xylan/chitin deacetylase (PgdA/CDA1 family)
MPCVLSPLCAVNFLGLRNRGDTGTRLPGGARQAVAALALAVVGIAAQAAAPVEVHQRLDLPLIDLTAPSVAPTVALTLDACGGAYDRDLIRFLVARRIPATLFVTRRWIEHNPVGLAEVLAVPDLFQLEDHGANHVPAVLGAGRRVYGLRGVGDLHGLAAEVEGGAAAIQVATGRAPHWYRGATAVYDMQAVTAIEGLGLQVAGFSLNADAGATLSRRAVAARVRAARDGDVIIAHMNKPRSQTAEGLADALADLQARGYRFVRLDQVALRAALPAAVARAELPAH